jgi:hypothetical protein
MYLLAHHKCKKCTKVLASKKEKLKDVKLAQLDLKISPSQQPTAYNTLAIAMGVVP